MKRVIITLIALTTLTLFTVQAQNTEYSRSGGKYLEMAALYR